jgi:hypothetical protein
LAFNRDQVSKLLVDVHRRCCICHRFCGVKIETDHIVPAGDGGTDNIENAIPVCFECHAEIHSYNDQHPRGRKFAAEELRHHKMHWLETCREHPELFIAVARNADVGPLQALIDELEFNNVVCGGRRGALFGDEQFRRAIAQGAIALLEPTLKISILNAYASTSRANQCILAEIHQDARSKTVPWASDAAQNAIAEASPKIGKALNELLGFLSSDERPT